MCSYPNGPGVRAGSPETSALAARSVAFEAANREAAALALIRAHGRAGLTADEVADALGWERYSARPRLSTLHAKRLIADSGVRRLGESKRRQAVWIAADLVTPAQVGEQAQLDLWSAA